MTRGENLFGEEEGARKGQGLETLRTGTKETSLGPETGDKKRKKRPTRSARYREQAGRRYRTKRKKGGRKQDHQQPPEPENRRDVHKIVVGSCERKG